MPPLRFEIPKSQKVIVIVVTALAVVASLALFATGRTLAGAGTAVLVIVLAVLYVTVIHDSYTELNDWGIVNKRGLMNNRIAWADVLEVCLEPKQRNAVLVRPRQGKAFKLATPVTAPANPDPGFAEHVARILGYARTHIPPQGAGTRQG